MLYKYKGLDVTGNVLEGYINGESRRDVLNTLKYEQDIIALYYLRKKINNPYVHKVRLQYDGMAKKVGTRIDTTFSKAKRTISKKEDKELKQIRKSQVKDKKKNSNLKSFFDVSKSSLIPKGLLNREKKQSKNDNELELIDDVFLDAEDSPDYQSLVHPDEDEVVITRIRDTSPKRRDLSSGKKIDWSLIDEEAESEEARKNRKLKIKEKEVLLFTRRLTIMLSSGVSLMRALTVLRDSTTSKMQVVIDGIINSIQEGNTLSQSIAKYPNQFDYTFVSLVSIGETSGSLDKCLKDIIYFKEKSMTVKKKIKTASIYPSIIGLLLGLVLILGSIFFIPIFEDMFTEQGMSLPGLTRLVFRLAHFVPYIVGALFLATIIMIILRRKNKKIDRAIRRFTDLYILRLPVLKNVLNSSYMFTLSSVIALMLRNGIRIKDALGLAQRTIPNVYLKSEISTASELMMQGLSFSESLEKQPNIDTLLSSVALTGEESGKMSEVLRDISVYYDDELNKYVDNLMELVQPISIIAIGLIAIPVVIAIYLPILEISSGSTMGL